MALPFKLQGHPWSSLRQGDPEMVSGVEGAALTPHCSSFMLSLSICAMTVKVGNPEVLHRWHRGPSVWSNTPPCSTGWEVVSLVFWEETGLWHYSLLRAAYWLPGDFLTQHTLSLFLPLHLHSTEAKWETNSGVLQWEEITPTFCGFGWSSLFYRFSHLLKPFSKS